MKWLKRPMWLLLAFLLLCGCKANATQTAASRPEQPVATYTLQAPQTTAAAEVMALPAQKAPDFQVEDGVFSIVWFSDIQNYSEHFPDITDSMTDWIVQNAEPLNIQYVITTGDYVNHTDAPDEWANANRALSKLDGKVPLFAIAGNHDTQDHSYETYLSFFGEARFESLPTFGGAYAGGRGRYDLVDVGDVHLLLLGMGYSVDADGIVWMNEILRQYPDRMAILCFHGYMDPDGSYTSDGENLFPQVVAPNRNVKLVLCGHRHGVFHNEASCDSDGDGTADHKVYQLVSDYQDERDGGSGYLSILSFNPEKCELKVTAYSPYLHDYNMYSDSSEAESFTLTMDLLS